MAVLDTRERDAVLMLATTTLLDAILGKAHQPECIFEGRTTQGSQNKGRFLCYTLTVFYSPT